MTKSVLTRAPASAQGFTLIELLITIAIVGILAALANASYKSSVVKSRRSTAKTCLLEGAQFMERFYTLNFAYDKTPPPGNTAVVLPACSAEISTYYTVGLVTTATPASTFLLQAVPQGDQSTADTKCGTLTIDQTGAKTKSGTGTVSDCW